MPAIRLFPDVAPEDDAGPAQRRSAMLAAGLSFDDLVRAESRSPQRLDRDHPGGCREYDIDTATAIDRARLVRLVDRQGRHPAIIPTRTLNGTSTAAIRTQNKAR